MRLGLPDGGAVALRHNAPAVLERLVQPLRPDPAGERFAVQRDKPVPAAQPLLAHHLPARRVVEMAGHAGHLLAVADFDGVVQHQNLRPGLGLQSPDGLQSDTDW